MKLSVIVPVYNSALYLRDCLDSLLNQDLSAEEYEIICVNDGSTDESPSILEEYKAQHRNIQVLHQENQGYCAAQNNGYAVARGTYIWYFNSDDIVDNDCFGSIVQWMDTYHIDCLSGRNQKIPADTDYKTICREKHLTYNPLKKPNVSGGGAKIFRKSMMDAHNIRWDVEAGPAADAELLLYVHIFSQKIVGVDSFTYYQRMRADSLSHSSSKKTRTARANGFLHFCRLYTKEAQSGQFDKKTAKHFLARVRFSTQYYLFEKAMMRPTNAELNAYLAELKAEGFYPYKPLAYSLRPRKPLKQFFIKASMFLFPVEGYYRLFVKCVRKMHR